MTVVATAQGQGVTEQTIYRWRKLYDGMQVSDVKKLKSLSDENARLKKQLAERDLEVVVMKEIQSKKL
ncbi:MAG: transposase [Cellvibrionaceae bacterium]